MRCCICSVDAATGLGGGGGFLGASAVMLVVTVDAVVGITGGIGCGFDVW